MNSLGYFHSKLYRYKSSRCDVSKLIYDAIKL